MSAVPEASGYRECLLLNALTYQQPACVLLQVPACFAEDLLAVLGPERPDHRWLIWGPARSGSTFHKDPNATSAWNAVVRGRKHWILYPPNTQPPGTLHHASHMLSSILTGRGPASSNAGNGAATCPV